jgi:hypothetical protein
VTRSGHCVLLHRDENTCEETTAPIIAQCDGAASEAPSATAAEARLTKNKRTMFGILHDAGERGLPLEDWNEKIKGTGIGVKRRADLTDIRSALKAKRLIRQTARGWVVNH